MKKIRFLVPFFLLFSFGFSGPVLASTETLTMIGGNGALGEVDAFSEGSVDQLNWGPTYYVGTHPWANLSGTNQWVNVYPCQGHETHDVLGNAITNAAAQCGIGTTANIKNSWIRIRFNLPGDFSNASMDLQMNADNRGTVSLNGTQLAVILGQSVQSGDFSPAVLAGLLQSGTNEVLMKLEDWGGRVAFQYRVDLNFDTDDGGGVVIPHLYI